MSNEKLIYENLDDETNAALLPFCTPFRPSYVKCNGFILPEYFKDFGGRIKEMEIRDDDIWVCSFPKTGTTWVQEMVWCISNNCDFDAAKKFLQLRFPSLERSAVYDVRKLMGKNPAMAFQSFGTDSVDRISKLSSPRFVKSHIPFSALPEKLQNNSTSAKIIYVTRNSRDTCISYYHHYKFLEGFSGSFEELAELFLKGTVFYGPFFNHIKEYWQQRDNPNILFLKYEEMKKDLKSVIYKTADFIGKSLTEENVQLLLDHLSFSKMKNNRAVNYEPVIELIKSVKMIEGGSFIRRGIVGEWKEVMGSNLSERFEKWEQENLKDLPDFTF